MSVKKKPMYDFTLLKNQLRVITLLKNIIIYYNSSKIQQVDNTFCIHS